MSWPPIPDWQISELQKLAIGGELSGVNPVALGVIDDAESSGSGGGINPENYGGWFGLGVGSTYPAGTPTAALLSATTPAAFDTQAEIAASTFAQDLNAQGGNPVLAEEVYQSGKAAGPTEGSKIMASFLGMTQPAATPATSSTAAPSSSSASTPATATTTGLSLSDLNPADWAKDLGTVFSTIADDIKTWVFIGLFTVAGAGLVILGLRSATERPQAPAVSPETVAALAPEVAAA